MNAGVYKRLAVFCFWFGLCCLPLFASEYRVALVIGNGRYENTPLVNPPNDAEDMANKLQQLGFTVLKGINLDYHQMIEYVRDFRSRLSGPDTVALFYYSGHGVQVDGKNYLIPVDSDIQSLDEVESLAVPVDFVYNKLQDQNIQTSIIILDACRNNPFAGKMRSADRGLSVEGRYPPQSIIVYSTGPNQTAKDGTGRNGTFTAALLHHLDDPTDIELMLRSVRDEVNKETYGDQVPWTNSSLTGGFCFVENAPQSGYTIASVSSLVPLSVADLPPETDVSMAGKTYLTTTARGTAIIGNFSPGTYMLSFHGPYIEPKQLSVTLTAGKSAVITPELTELGKVRIYESEREASVTKNVQRSYDGDNIYMQRLTSDLYSAAQDVENSLYTSMQRVSTNLWGKSIRFTGGTYLNTVIHPEQSGQKNIYCTFDFDGVWEDYLPVGTYTLHVRKLGDTADGYTKTFSVQGAADTEFSLPKVDYSSEWKLSRARQQKLLYEEKLAEIPAKQKTARSAGWTLFSIGSVCTAAAITTGILSYNAASGENITGISSNVWSTVCITCTATAGASFLLSPIAFHMAPRGDNIEASIRELDRQIEKLSAEQQNK